MTREEREDMWADALAGMVIAEAKRLYGLPAPKSPKPRTPRKTVSIQSKPRRRHMRRKKAI